MERTRHKHQLPAKPGPKSGCTPRVIRQVEGLCKLGVTNVELAEILEVNIGTVEYWWRNIPEFKEAVKRGKEQADVRVVESLYKRALGYEYEETRQVTGINRNGQKYHYTTRTKKRVPADTTAAIFWLKNRQRRYWADTHRMEHSGTIEHHHMDLEDLTSQEKSLLKSITKKRLRQQAIASN